MVELIRLSKPRIIRQVGEESFHKAKAYLHEGAWTDLRVQGDILKGRCRGKAMRPYRVSVVFNGDEIARADCSCPVGAGGHCKHVAALLLFHRDHAEAFAEVEELDVVLERRSKGELIALVRRMIRRVPELESLLDSPLPGYSDPAAAEDPEWYRRQACAVFDHTEDQALPPAIAARELADIVATGDEFRSIGADAAAGAVYRAVAEEVLRRFEGIDDEQGVLLGIVSDCAAGLCACLRSAPGDAAHRESIIRSLVDLYVADEAHGGLGVSDSIPEAILHQTTPGEQNRVAGWLRERIPGGKSWSEVYQRRAIGALLAELEAGEPDDVYGRLTRCRQEAESHIAERSRDGYRFACACLKKMRALSKRLNENGMWNDYLAGLRERYRSLRAFREEMVRAGL
jgi:uncharacterized Zn finger protein